MLVSYIRKSFKSQEKGTFLAQDLPKIARLNNFIVVVGMLDSPHFQKWFEWLKLHDQTRSFLLFPSDRPRFRNGALSKLKKADTPVRIFQLLPSRYLNFFLFCICDVLFGKKWRAYFLAKLIIRNSPNCIHFHEMQHAAYLYNLIYGYKDIPTNIRKVISTWGSDLLYHKFSDYHAQQIFLCLQWADILTSEREEDLGLARALGFDSKFLAPVYVTFGRTEIVERTLDTPSCRKIILVKGYQHDQGLAVNALEALTNIASNLSGFQVKVFSASPVVKDRVEQMRSLNLIDIEVLSWMPTYDLQNIFAKSRLYIGLSQSDGLPASFVDAMQYGAFPIQSIESAAGEFIKHGIGGYLVDPWKIGELENYIVNALVDDRLVDDACELNLEMLRMKRFEVLTKRLDFNLYP